VSTAVAHCGQVMKYKMQQQFILHNFCKTTCNIVLESLPHAASLLQASNGCGRPDMFVALIS